MGRNVLIFALALNGLAGLNKTALAADAYGDAAVVEAYALVNVSAEQGARMIREFFDANGVDNAPVDVVPDLRSNSLIVACPPSTQERVSRVLAEIDVVSAEPAVFQELKPLPNLPTLQVRVVKLEYADCEEVAHQMSSLFETGEGAHKVTWFKPVNAVLLRSTTAEVEQMAAVISEIDLPPAKSEVEKKTKPQTQVIYLKHADAADLAPVVSSYASPMAGRRRGLGRLQVLVAERLNSLILRGAEEAVSDAKALVAQLDVQAGPS